MLENKKILVIGGAGFIGSNLIQQIVENNQVTSLDNYSTGNKQNHISGARYVTGQAKNISSLFLGEHFDLVFHFGEYSRVEQSLDELETVLDFNLYSIASVVDFVNKLGAKLIYSGSSTKFGDKGKNKHASPYAWTKATNTEFINNYAEWYGLNYAIVYFYNAYGPREISDGKYATLIAKYLKLCELGEESLPVVKPGSQKRNFTHVQDIVTGILAVAEAGYGDGYGIGADESFSITQVVSMFSKDIRWLPERAGNRLSAELVSQKTRELGWKPTKSLESYIEECLSKIT